MGNVLEDIRYSLRGFLKSPMFTIVALISIALGIGANTAIFSLMDQALIRSMPVQHPEELVLFQSPGPRRGSIDTSYDDKVTYSYPMYRDLRDGSSSVFSGVLARFPISFSMSWHGGTDRIHGDLVSGNYFDVLGTRAALGRTLTQDDDRTPSAHPVAVISYGFWKRRFGADPAVLNQSILLNATPMTVVGVTMEGFNGVGVGEAPDVFVPMMMRAQMSPGRKDLDDRRSMWLNVFARLKPGVSRQQAEVAMNTYWRPILAMESKDMSSLSPSNRTRFLNQHLSLLPAGHGISASADTFGGSLRVLMAMVALLLLIACANVANLLIARATARQREIGIRLAIGASRAQLVRQLLIESLLLALGGGLLGLLAADWTGQALLHFLPDDPSLQGFSAQPDARVFLFALALSVLTGLLFGLVPALQGTRTQLASTLKDQAAGIVGGFGNLRLRKILVVTQVALSLILLIGSGLFARSLYNAKNINTGFRTDHLISFSIQPSLNGYTEERTRALFERLQENISRLPGIRAVSLSEVPLLSGDNDVTSITVEGYHPKEDESMGVNMSLVGPGFFGTMGMPLLAGRDFTPGDGPNSPKVAVVSNSFANLYFPGQNAIGRHIRYRKEPDMEIVGVVQDGKMVDIREKPGRFVYFVYSQHPTTGTTFYARTAQDPVAAVQMIRQEVQRQDSNLPIFSVKTMEHQIDEALFMDRLVAALSTAFGVLATVLAAVGLYGVMAFMVLRRTREIGIRMALGADPRDVLRLVMREAVQLAGAGIVIAVLASFGLGRLVQSQLLGVSGNDPLVMIAATVTLTGIAMLAGFLPALRASRVDPLTALRHE